METIIGIPASDVGRVVQDFVDDGASHVIVQKDGDGTYTVSRS